MNHPTTPVRARHVVAMADRLSESAMDVAEVGASAAGYADWAPVWEQVTRKYHRRRQALIRLARALDAQVTAAAGYEPRCTVCEVSIEYVDRHPDGHRGGWRHTTDHGQEPHTAFPGGTS